MKLKIFVWFLSFVVFIECIENQTVENNLTTETTFNINFNNETKNNTIKNNINDTKIKLTKITSIEKLSPAYTIPDNLTFIQYYDEHFKNNKIIKELTSEYPNPPGQTIKYDIEVNDATGIEVIVHLLNIDPTTDFLTLTSLPTNTFIEPQRVILTGKLEQTKFRFLGTNKLKINFGGYTKKPDHKNMRFLLTYQPYGKLPPVITFPPDVTIPFDELEVITKLIIVNTRNQNTTTWYSMKNAICKATNEYLKFSSLDKILEPCFQNNVTFKSIVKCSSDLPQSTNCVELNMAVSLYSNAENKIALDDPFFEEIIPRSPKGLNYSQLNIMWDRFGKKYMTEAGYAEYTIPTSVSEMFLWFGVGIGCLLILFLTVIVIMKSGLSRKIQNNHSSDKHKILKNSNEIDITMYPSPHQAVPELFPHPGITFYNDSSKHLSQNGKDLTTVNEEYRDGGVNPGFIHDNEDEEQILKLNRPKLNVH